MDKGSVIFYSENQGELYRAAALVGRKVLSTSDEHTNIPSPPKWLYEEGSVEFLIAKHSTAEKLNHEVANAIIYDMDDDSFYFERLSCKSWAEAFEGDDYFSPVKAAKSPQEFASLVKKHLK